MGRWPVGDLWFCDTPFWSEIGDYRNIGGFILKAGFERYMGNLQ